MKRFLLAVLIIITGVTSASAFDNKYRGYFETHFGAYLPSQYYGSGGAFGFSSSHGFDVYPGVSVGIGFDFMFGNYEDPNRDNDYYDHDSSIGYYNLFLEGKYRILHSKPVSPFVGLRLGAGIGGDESGDDFIYPYISPEVGCSINLSRRFGIDLGVGYAFHGSERVSPSILVYNSSVQFRFGFHF